MTEEYDDYDTWYRILGETHTDSELAELIRLWRDSVQTVLRSLEPEMVHSINQGQYTIEIDLVDGQPRALLKDEYNERRKKLTVILGGKNE